MLLLLTVIAKLMLNYKEWINFFSFSWRYEKNNLITHSMKPLPFVNKIRRVYIKGIYGTQYDCSIIVKCLLVVNVVSHWTFDDNRRRVVFASSFGELVSQCLAITVPYTRVNIEQFMKMVFNAAFNNCSVISRRFLGKLPVLLVHLS